jgi:hypothetical protein
VNESNDQWTKTLIYPNAANSANKPLAVWWCICRSLDFRIEAFNAFNHAQFYGPASVDGQVDDPNFGHIISANSPRLFQLVAKFNF